MSQESIDLLNKALRPWMIGALCGLAFLFMTAMGGIMLFRYAVFGEINLEGLATFVVAVVGPIVKHFNDRAKLYQSGRLVAPELPPMVNPAALA